MAVRVVLSKWAARCRPPFSIMTFDLKSQLTIQKGTISDYKVLDRFHYLNTPLPPVKAIYTICPKPVTDRNYCSGFQGPNYGHAALIAVIVYSAPLRDLKARTTATGGFFKQPKTLSERLKLINKHALYVSRLVVLPSYRHLGLADWLWRETLKLQTVSIVESLTPLPVNEKWLKSLGFQIFYSPTPESIRRLKNAFRKARISEKCYTVPQIAQNRIDALNNDDRIRLDRSLHDFLSKYRAHEHDESGIKRTIYILSKLPYPNGYLIWFNPYLKHNPVLDWIVFCKKTIQTGFFKEKTR